MTEDNFMFWFLFLNAEEKEDVTTGINLSHVALVVLPINQLGGV